jgi:hypothetical protein
MKSCKTQIKIKVGIIQRLIFAEIFGSIVKLERSSIGINTIRAMINVANIIIKFIIEQALY